MLRQLLFFVMLLFARLAVGGECEKPLVVSYTGDWKPFFYKTGYRDFDGHDYQLLKRIADSLSCPIAVLTMTEKRALIELSKGTFDIIIGASVTPSRQQSYFFSLPYREEVAGLLYIDSAEEMNRHTLESILNRGGTVAVNTSGFFGDKVEQLKARHSSQFVHKASPEGRFNALINEEVNAVIDDKLALCMQLKVMQEERKAEAVSRHGHAIKMSVEELNRTDIHFMFSRKTVSGSLINQFNRVLVTTTPKGDIGIPNCFTQALTVKTS